MFLFFRKKSRRARLRDAFGKPPATSYFPGDMDYIRAYADILAERNPENPFIDDITWNDLATDAVFRRLNACRSTSGEQYLYYMLRSPAQTQTVFDERNALIDTFSADEKRRLDVACILDRLGCVRRADLSTAFLPADHGKTMLFVYLFFALLLPLSLLTLCFSEVSGVLALIGTLTVNAILHAYGVRRVRDDYDTVNYTAAMVRAMNRIRNLHNPELDRRIGHTYPSLDRLKAVSRCGGAARLAGRDIGEVLLAVLLIDLILYEFLKNKLARNYRDIFTVHETLGKLDAAISVASYRASLDGFAVPEIDFSKTVPPFIDAREMRHPLLDRAVPNDLVTGQPILITGSNASGKSTYLKTAALCVLLAQAVCTCPAASYRATAFCLYSSMALSDDLLAGESYYIAETRSLRRIVRAAEDGESLFCVIDEVLRGTNTVERIAASSEVLGVLAEKGCLCIAATHDIELCDLLSPAYALYHFEEQLGDNEMLFDYLLRPGKATSRNAINLLKLIGFGDRIVDGAHARANRYMKDGKWT